MGLRSSSFSEPHEHIPGHQPEMECHGIRRPSPKVGFEDHGPLLARPTTLSGCICRFWARSSLAQRVFQAIFAILPSLLDEIRDGVKSKAVPNALLARIASNLPHFFANRRIIVGLRSRLWLKNRVPVVGLATGSQAQWGYSVIHENNATPWYRVS